MLKLLFWNVNGRYREELCASMAHERSISILALAECRRPEVVLSMLNPVDRPARYHLIPTGNGNRIHLFTTYQPQEFSIERETTHYSIRRLELLGKAEVLIVFLHQRSKLRRSDSEQNGDFRDLAEAITEVENRRGHQRTVLVGDLNADPFQEGVYAADGLHAVSTRAVASRRTRIVNGKEYRFFYNPMWRFFGDATSGPPGTYFWQKSERLCRFWHIYDQAMVRPDLLPYFRDLDLDIITEHKLTRFNKPSSGAPNPEVASDHFPIVVALDHPEVKYD